MKTYMGDGVFVHLVSDGTVALTTEDGVSVTNTIYLEQAVLCNFIRFAYRGGALPVGFLEGLLDGR